MEINKEFKDLVPPLSQEEKEQLESNLLNEGWRENERIFTWNNQIVDGHHRYELCKKHNIGFKTQELDFDSKEDVKVWMINEQKGRRNLTDGWKWALALTKKDLLKEKGREKLSEAGKEGNEIRWKDESGLSKIDKGDKKEIEREEPSSEKETQQSTNPKTEPKHDTRKEISRELGWSSGKVGMAEKVWKDADDNTKEDIKEGKKSFNEAYQEITKAEKEKEREEKLKQQREELEKEELEKPSGKYDVIVIDPPWQYHSSNVYDAKGFRGTCPYPTMSVEEIKNINLPAKDDCVLWLWTTNKHIFYCKEILEEWGFEIKSVLTWDKEHIAIGKWLRSQTEHCILAIKGNPYYHNTKYGTLIREKRGKHSAKPESFYKMVEEICAGRKLDYFARKKREGWDVYGDEVNEKEEVSK